MSRIRLKLRELLNELRVRPQTVERVARDDLGYPFGENSIYRILKTEYPSQVNLESLNAIIHALRHHTGQDIQVSDVLEYVPSEA